MLPITKKEWERRGSFKIPRPRERAVLHGNVTWLLERLYKPEPKVGYTVNREVFGGYDLASGAINWGDLRVVEVTREDGHSTIYIEEAAPDAFALQQYIQDWLRAWGWPNVRVRTEW